MHSNDQVLTTLAAQLEEFAAEHELYQQTELGGAVDPEWSQWYCRRIKESECLDALGVQLTDQELRSRLERGFECFSADPQHRLAELMARQILESNGIDL